MCHRPVAYCRAVTSTTGLLLIDVEGAGSGINRGAIPLGDSGSRSDRRRWWLGDGPAGEGRVGPIFAFSIFAFSTPGVWVTNYRNRTPAPG